MSPPGRLRSLIGITLALGAFAGAAALLSPLHLVLRRHSKTAGTMPRLFHRIVCRALHVRIEHNASSVTDGPVLYVCNHVSWLDVFILGRQLPAAFVAKSEVRRWPLVGWLAQLQPTLFVVRHDLRGARSQARALADLLARHRHVILFAEGTSTDGTHVLPFKSALFDGLADLADLRVQPLTLTYTDLSGVPVNDLNRDRVAWYGDMTLPPHLFRLAGERRIGVALDFHPAFAAAAEPDRKALARRCETMVRAGHQRLAASDQTPSVSDAAAKRLA